MIFYIKFDRLTGAVIGHGRAQTWIDVIAMADAATDVLKLDASPEPFDHAKWRVENGALVAAG